MNVRLNIISIIDISYNRTADYTVQYNAVERYKNYKAYLDICQDPELPNPFSPREVSLRSA